MTQHRSEAGPARQRERIVLGGFLRIRRTAGAERAGAHTNRRAFRNRASARASTYATTAARANDQHATTHAK